MGEWADYWYETPGDAVYPEPLPVPVPTEWLAKIRTYSGADVDPDFEMPDD